MPPLSILDLMLKLPLLVITALSLTLSGFAHAAPAFAQESSDLKAAQAARFGKLPNGVRYVVYPNAEPKGRASLRLVVLAGSLHETEEQRGLAHFLEHMAFNGSKHYAPGTLVEFFQHLGMSFGGDTNASTNFDRTQYKLELPHTDAGTIEKGLQLFEDYADGLLLLDEEINKERGIILSEKRTRDDARYRAFVHEFEFMLGDTLLPKRLPIGEAAVIEKAPRARFKDFWDHWYRPEKLVVVAVGDFDAAAVEKQIVDGFTALKPRAEALPEPNLGKLPEFKGVRAYYHSEPETSATSVGLALIRPKPVEPDNAANRLKELPRQFALSILNRRFSELAKKENAPFISGGAGVADRFNFMRQAGVTLSCKPEQWQAALTVCEQELRRALEHGFQEPELKEIIADFRNTLDQAVKSASTRHSSGLADEISGNVVDEEVFMDPADERALYLPALDTITAKQCLEALRETFAAPGRFVSVSGNAKIDGDAAAAITRVWEESSKVPVSGPEKRVEASWAYTDWGKPGKVASRKRVEDLDIELITFANGVRLNIKKTDFEAGQIRLGARVGDGAITEPTGKRGITALAGATFQAGGLGKHSVDDLKRILAGKNVGFQFAPSPDAFVLSGSTTREDLLLELQLMTAALTDAGWRPESLRQAHKGLEQLFESFKHNANGPMATEIAALLANNDPRFGLPAKDVMMSRNLEEIQAWLKPQLSTGAIELSVVGDLDIEATIDAVSKTFGALPERNAKSTHDDLRKVRFPEQPFNSTFTIASEIPKSTIAVYWPTTDGLDAQRARRLTLLASVLNDRLRVKIREEIAGTYSPNAGSNASDVFPGYGYIQAGCIVDPAMADQIRDMIVQIGDELARNGVTDEELDRARQPMLTSIRESERNNAYWSTRVLARAQEHPVSLDWARTRLKDIESISAAELSELAKKYLGRDRASRVKISPGKM